MAEVRVYIEMHIVTSLILKFGVQYFDLEMLI
jgi:hypothetical protein